jgi:hypothetical protein
MLKYIRSVLKRRGGGGSVGPILTLAQRRIPIISLTYPLKLCNIGEKLPEITSKMNILRTQGEGSREETGFL